MLGRHGLLLKLQTFSVNTMLFSRLVMQNLIVIHLIYFVLNSFEERAEVLNNNSNASYESMVASKDELIFHNSCQTESR